MITTTMQSSSGQIFEQTNELLHHCSAELSAAYKQELAELLFKIALLEVERLPNDQACEARKDLEGKEALIVIHLSDSTIRVKFNPNQKGVEQCFQ